MNKIPIIDENDLQGLIELAIKNDGELTTTKGSQMLKYIPGVSINTKPRKDGRYQGYVKDEDFKFYFYGHTLEELCFKIKYHLKNGLPRKEKRQSRTKLKEWLDKWVNLYKAPNVKPIYLENIKQLLKPVYKEFGDRSISSLTTDELQAFFVSMTALRARDECKRLLNESLNKAVRQKLIKDNPCADLEIKTARKGQKRGLTLSEQNRFIEVIRGNQYEPLCLLLLNTGIRIGEALALTQKDIDRENKYVNINKDVVFINGEKIVQPPKTAAANRSIPLSDTLIEILPTSDTLFDISYNAVRCAFRRFSDKLNFIVTPHKLRHTFATRLEEKGISPKMRQYLLGHASVSITENIYTDVQRTYVDEMKERITGIFDTKKDPV